MFTGIVEEVGAVRAVDLENAQESFVIQSQVVAADAHPGDSIAVNGTCLTVTRLDDQGFVVGVMPETVRRTNLARLAPGDTVNLERALLPSSRLGGHFVQGHVDGVGTVARVAPDGPALSVYLVTTPELLRYIVEKGFITVDGISLTVTEVDDSGFGVGLVSYTQDHIASGLLTAGHQVNLEVDILAKYVEKLVVH